MKTITAILPTVNDAKQNISGFCTSLFSDDNVCELIICQETDGEVFADLPDEIKKKIKIYGKDREHTALKDALNDAQGDFILITDIYSTYAPGALALMSEGICGCACNVGFVSGESCVNIFRENFTFNELSSESVHSNYLLRTDVIRKNNLEPRDTDIFNFIGLYFSYDNCSLIHRTLVYTVSLPKTENSLITDAQYAESVKNTGNYEIILFYIRSIMRVYSQYATEENFESVKVALSVFADDVAVSAWVASTFGVDMQMLSDKNSTFPDFVNNGKNIYYKEKCLPIIEDDVVMNFYAGRFGIGVLKRCIAAWVYYKLYRRKDGFIKKIGCKICKRFLGGDFDA